MAWMHSGWRGVILVFIEVVEWFFGNVVVISVAKFRRFAFTFFWIVPWLNFTGCPNWVNNCCHNEDTEGHPENETPFFERWLKIKRNIFYKENAFKIQKNFVEEKFLHLVSSFQRKLGRQLQSMHRFHL